MTRMQFVMAAALSLACAAPRANSTDQTSIGILYPRNETYKLTGPMPIVLGVYNLPPTEALGNYSIDWWLSGFSRDNTPGGLSYGQGTFNPQNETWQTGKPLILADFVDLMEAFTHAAYDFGGRMQINVLLNFQGSKSLPDICGHEEYSADISNVGFRVEQASNSTFSNTAAPIDIDLLQATGCPAAGAGVAVSTAQTVSASATTSCITPVVTPTQQAGCPFSVDSAMASSISSSVSVLMIPPPTETLPTYTSNRAGAMPVQTGGLAAAGIIAAIMVL